MNENALDRTIRLLIENGDLDCEECNHRATDIEKLVNVVESAQKLVGKTSGWRVRWEHNLPESWIDMMADVEKKLEALNASEESEDS